MRLKRGTLKSTHSKPKVMYLISSLTTESQRWLTIADVPRLKNSLAVASGLWFQLGIGLGLSPDSLMHIAGCAGGNNTTALIQTLQLWITEPGGSPATLQTLTDCLASEIVNRASLAQQLMENEEHYGIP